MQSGVQAEGAAQPGPYEALGRVVHAAQLEALLVPEALGQGVPDVIGGKGFLAAVLELRKYCLGIDRQPGG